MADREKIEDTSIQRRALLKTIKHVAPAARLILLFCFLSGGIVYLIQPLRNEALADIAAHRLTAVAFLGAQVTFLFSFTAGAIVIGAFPAGVAAWRYTKQFYNQALASERDASSSS